MLKGVCDAALLAVLFFKRIGQQGFSMVKAVAETALIWG